MIRRYGPLLLMSQFLGDLALTLLSVKLAEQLRLHLVTHLERRDQFVAVHPYVYLLVLVVWAAFFFLFGVFEPRHRTSLLRDLGNLWVSVTVSMLVLASLFYLISPATPDTPSRLFFGYLFVIDLTLVTLAHVATFQTLGALRRGGKHLRRVLLVGTGLQGRHVAIRLRDRKTAGLELVGYLGSPRDASLAGLERLGDMDSLLEVVREHPIDEVVIALPAEAHAEVLRMTAMLGDTETTVRVLPDVFEMVAMKARVEDFYGLPLISITEPSITPIQARVKRAFDIVLAGIVGLLCLPLAALIALLVRLGSPGPVLVNQRRVGAAGKPFFMHKFRTMSWDPADLDLVHTKHPDDPRVTGTGKWLRRTSLDELPQLWNVIVGEMSLVGPRPELPAIVENYEPWQRKRFLVPPGMTGWWQVNGRSDRSMHLNTEIDLFYVQNYSILLDLKILARTLGAVIRGKGAY